MPDISLIAMIGAAPMSGIVCSAYKASRFAAVPVPYDTAPPGGAADAVATSGDAFGGPGRVSLTVPTFEEYWVAISSGGHVGWVKSPSPVVPESDVTALIADLAFKAPLASPTFTGIVTAPVANIVSAAFAGKPRFDVSHPAFGAKLDGATDDTAAIELASVAAAAAGGGAVYIPYTAAGCVIRRLSGQANGGIRLRPKVSLEGNNTKLLLRDNCAFITYVNPFGSLDCAIDDLGTSYPIATITVDVTVGMSAFTVNSSAGFTVGDEVFLKLGDDLPNPRGGGSYETQWWTWAHVLAIPDGTHLTLDMGADWTATVAGTSTQNRAIVKVVGVVEGTHISGFELFNDVANGGNAEQGISLRFVRNVRIDDVIGDNVGSGLIQTQFCRNLTGSNHLVRRVGKQGSASKGRCFAFGETYDVEFVNSYGASFETAAVALEGYCRNIKFRNSTWVNTFAGRPSTTAFFQVDATSDLLFDMVRLEGAGSLLFDTGGGVGSVRLRDPIFNVSGAGMEVDYLTSLEGRVRLHHGFPDLLLGHDYLGIKRWSTTFQILPSNTTPNLILPSGLWRRAKIYLSTKTGLTGLVLDNAGSGVISNADIWPVVVGGATVDLGAPGLGVMRLNGTSTSDFNSVPGTNALPRFMEIITDGTVPVGATGTIEVEYWPGQPYTTTDVDLEYDDNVFASVQGSAAPVAHLPGAETFTGLKQMAAGLDVGGGYLRIMGAASGGLVINNLTVQWNPLTYTSGATPAVTLDGPAVLNLGTGTATSVAVGRSGVPGTFAGGLNVTGGSITVPAASVALAAITPVPATDSLAAHLAGAESLTGVKTFTANPVFNAAAIPAVAVTLGASIAAASAGINSTETQVVGLPLPAGSTHAGTTYRITASGVCTSSAANVGHFRARIGTTTLTGNIAVDVSPTAAASGTAIPFSVDILVTVRTSGAGGSVIGAGNLANNGVTGVSAAATVVAQSTATVALDTTAAKILELTFQAAAATTTCTFHDAAITPIVN